jgi:hypothetical protein
MGLGMFCGGGVQVLRERDSPGLRNCNDSPIPRLTQTSQRQLLRRPLSWARYVPSLNATIESPRIVRHCMHAPGIAPCPSTHLNVLSVGSRLLARGDATRLRGYRTMHAVGVRRQATRTTLSMLCPQRVLESRKRVSSQCPQLNVHYWLECDYATMITIPFLSWLALRR